MNYTIMSSYMVKTDGLIGSDIIVVYSSRLSNDIENWLERIREKGVKVVGIDELHKHLTNIDHETAELIGRYLRIGGSNNLKSLIKLLLKLLGLYAGRISPPENVPMHGIYHPKLGVFSEVKDYLRRYKYRDRPLVGILFYRSDWLYGKTLIVDKLVNALESRELGVIPVFTYGFKDSSIRSPSKEESIRKFLMLNGKPLIKLLINMTSFFMSTRKARRSWSATDVVNDEGSSLLKDLNVPVIQAIRMFNTCVREWLKSEKGIDYSTLTYSVAMPEVNGIIEPIVAAGTRIEELGNKVYELINEHIEWIADRVKAWINLMLKPAKERRIAIILINPPCKGVEANVAVGMGLDVPESVVRFLKFLKECGYEVGNEIPNSGEELVKLIMSRRAISEFRWTSVEEIVSRGGALGFVDRETYLKWFNELPERVKRLMIKEWGDPSDVLEGRVNKELVGMVWKNSFVIPGIRLGNIVIVPQPKRGCAGARCDGKVCKILHNPRIPPPHQWLAVYRWLTRVFKADVIIHFGTHGYLEFLPGKGVGLSWLCWPEISIDNVPHLYVYIVSNPMEGSVAKRRGYAVIIDHLHPPLMLSDKLRDLEDLLSQYFRAESAGDKVRVNKILEELERRVEDLKIPIGSNESLIESVRRYVELIGNTYINSGLHILGSPPTDPDRLGSYVVSAMSIRVGDQKPIWEVIADYAGIEKVNNILKIKLNRVASRVISRLIKCGGDLSKLGEILRNECLSEGLSIINASINNGIIESFRKALQLAEMIARCRRELRSLLKAVEGGYVEPGASGSITRGRYEVLPTGRNFFLVDPRSLPTRAAWLVGVESAKKLIDDYLKRHGKYPETVGEVLWSIDAFKADGEQLSRILYLLGVKPVWDESGCVTDVEVIPIEELGRPRIDVVVRISGIVRDTLPNYIELINKAISKVLTLNEPDNVNYVKKHYREYVEELISKGVKREEARELARYRVFGPPPGAYGAGVNLAIEASAWRDKDDLARIWIQWGGYAYSPTADGVKAFPALTLNLKSVDLVARNHVSDEHDLLGCCCYFGYHGGFINAACRIKGKPVEGIIIDTRDPANPEVRGVREELDRIVLSKLLNESWVKEMKKHGYRGASEMQRKILHLYGWGASTGLVRDEWFEEIARKYVLNREMREWFKRHNVWALEEMTRRLIEAAERGVWSADRELINMLKEVYSEIEGDLEDEIEVPSNIQGGSIDIYGPEDIREWRNSLREVDKWVRELVKLGERSE